MDPDAPAEIGDVRGLRIIHLQCHFGLDTICLARRGAHVTGLDFSPAAITEARKLAAQTDTDARFVEGNVQRFGRAFEEASILAAGHAYQQATDWHLKRPPV